MTTAIASIILLRMLAPAGVSYFIDPPNALTPAVYQIAVNRPTFIPSQSRGVAASAHTVLVVDDASGTVLYQANDLQKPHPIASITKLATALTFLEFNPGWDTAVTIKQEDLRPGGRQYLWPGEVVTTRQLFELLLVSSSNEAAAALSRVATTTDFPAQMNATATRLGMEHSYFIEPTGLDPLNVASVQDVARLATAAFHNAEISTITRMPSVTFQVSNNRRTVVAESTDQLLQSYLTQAPYVFEGAKTGYLEEAGYCFVMRLSRDGHPITLVLLGARSQADRWQEAKGITEWVFRHYRWPTGLTLGNAQSAL